MTNARKAPSTRLIAVGTIAVAALVVLLPGVLQEVLRCRSTFCFYGSLTFAPIFGFVLISGSNSVNAMVFALEIVCYAGLVPAAILAIWKPKAGLLTALYLRGLDAALSTLSMAFLYNAAFKDIAATPSQVMLFPNGEVTLTVPRLLVTLILAAVYIKVRHREKQAKSAPASAEAPQAYGNQGS